MTYYIIQVFDIAFFVSYKFRPALSNTGNENTNGRLVLGAWERTGSRGQCATSDPSTRAFDAGERDRDAIDQIT